ncbi:CoA transferase, partial [Pauljensenia sp. UMB1177]
MNIQLLDGVKVIDFSTMVAAPTTARVLADWGADVLKVEAP